MLFTLIIAAYNIQDYIGECLESCLNQDEFSHDDYEIIVINDGSKDNTKNIVEEYGRNYPNIRLITQDNAGLSAARNTGIKNAKGDYIWFIDGDDKISNNALSILSKNIKQNAADAYLIDYTEFYEDCKITKNIGFVLPVKFSAQKYLKSTGILPMMAWLTIYKKDFLKENNLKFTVGIIREDLDFSVRCFSLANNCCHINENLYVYRKNRPDSIMNKPKREKTSLKSMLLIEEAWKSHGTNHKIDSKILKKPLAILSYFILSNPYCYEVFKKERRSKIPYYKMMLKGTIKDKIKVLLLIFLPSNLYRQFILSK